MKFPGIFLSHLPRKFRMDAVPFLFEDPEFRDEPRSHVTADSEDYLYLLHIYTWNYPEVSSVLLLWCKPGHMRFNESTIYIYIGERSFSQFHRTCP